MNQKKADLLYRFEDYLKGLLFQPIDFDGKPCSIRPDFIADNFAALSQLVLCDAMRDMHMSGPIPFRKEDFKAEKREWENGSLRIFHFPLLEEEAYTGAYIRGYLLILGKEQKPVFYTVHFDYENKKYFMMGMDGKDSCALRGIIEPGVESEIAAVKECETIRGKDKLGDHFNEFLEMAHAKKVYNNGMDREME